MRQILEEYNWNTICSRIKNLHLASFFFKLQLIKFKIVTSRKLFVSILWKQRMLLGCRSIKKKEGKLLCRNCRKFVIWKSIISAQEFQKEHEHFTCFTLYKEFFFSLFVACWHIFCRNLHLIEIFRLYVSRDVKFSTILMLLVRFSAMQNRDNKGKNRYHSILKLLKKRNDHSHSSRIVTIEIVLSLEFNPSSIVKRFLPFVSTSTRFIYPSKQVAHCY